MIRQLAVLALAVILIVGGMWLTRPDLAPRWGAGECLPVGRTLICKPNE